MNPKTSILSDSLPTTLGHLSDVERHGVGGIILRAFPAQKGSHAEDFQEFVAVLTGSLTKQIAATLALKDMLDLRNTSVSLNVELACLWCVQHFANILAKLVCTWHVASAVGKTDHVVCLLPDATPCGSKYGVCHGHRYHSYKYLENGAGC